MADGNQISVEPSKAQNVADYNATNLDKLLGMYKQETPRKALVHLLSGGEGGTLRHFTKSAVYLVDSSLKLHTCVENMC